MVCSHIAFIALTSIDTGTYYRCKGLYGSLLFAPAACCGLDCVDRSASTWQMNALKAILMDRKEGWVRKDLSLNACLITYMEVFLALALWAEQQVGAVSRNAFRQLPLKNYILSWAWPI